MLQKIKSFTIKQRYMITAFLVPFLIMMSACIAAGFYPFGDNQMAVIDMYHQYVPFLGELQHKLQTGGSLLYSWNGAAGTNFVSLMAYYTSSPLNILLVLVPQAWLMEAVSVIVFMKMGFAGMFMAVYLKHMYQKEDWATVAFSTLYALCAYVVGYYWCLMWLDAVALLPLCILGLNRLLDRGDFKLYVITLALMMFSNYYIGGIMCIFILFYFPVLYFMKKRDLGVKGCLKKIGQGVSFSVMGIGLSAFLLLPTFMSLRNTYYIDSEMPEEILFYRPILDIINNLLPHIEVTVRTGGPNLYCGLLCVILFAFYLMCAEIPLRKKMMNCVMLAFLVLSLNVNKLDFLWHGLHFPNQIPFRYSFVVSFILVGIAYEAFLHYRSITPKMIATAAAIGTVYVIITQKLYFEDFKPGFAYITLMLLFIYSGFLAMYRMDRFDKKLMKVLLLTIVIFEMVISTDSALQTVSYTDRTAYFAEAEEVRDLVTETLETDDDFYRMEMYNGLTMNAPMLYNYPGVSQFSSTVNADVSDFMDCIGVEGGGPKNRYNYNLADPVTNSILGIRYFVSRGMPINDETSLEHIKGSDKVHLYKNRYSLDMGYLVEPALLYTWNLRQDNPFDVLNDYVKLATASAENVFTRIDDVQVTSEDVDAGEYQSGYVECSSREDMEFGKVELTYTVPESQQIYVFVETKYAQGIYATRGDGRRILLSTDCGAVTSVGHIEAGDTVTITVEYEDGDVAPISSYVYGFNDAVWQAAYDRLDDETVKITSHSDTRIEGVVTASEDSMCVMSVPYEKGWKVKLDDRKVDVSFLGNAFIAVPVSAGEHTISLRFIPEGMTVGILLTMCSLAAFVIMCLFRRNKLLKK